MLDRYRANRWRGARNCLAILLIGWVAYAAMMSLMSWYFARDEARDHPYLLVLPEPLPDANAATLDGPRVARFGLSMQMPWSDILNQTDRRLVSVITFEEGRVTLLSPDFTPDAVKIYKSGTHQQTEIMRSVLGDKAMSSNYELLSAAIRTTPDQASLWGTRLTNARVVLQLVQKDLAMHDTRHIYELRPGNLRGFQFGDPQGLPYHVFLKLFDSHDRCYEIWITSGKKGEPAFTQAQVNAMVASIETTP